ncbi:hypothetical protein L3Y34_013435 [Caenorhabditis briggsae]|uniref:Calcineurin-like phosphoesterase domain-containing protein n=1 Tax=Caenorhabditis briggsae TaxID=6238 RepID=A0AAE9A1B2_CAEBR|nr:hypothetical protein L3Y34_013435 [Caenorhabditis briggsae]
MKLFAVLPIATRNKRFLFIHGGLASSLQTIEDFNEQYGKTRVVDLDTSIGESLWSDPHYGTKPWIFNRARHGGVEFSEAVTQDFCRRNGVRGNEEMKSTSKRYTM